MNPTEQITKRISELNSWRGTRLARLRKLIGEAGPSLTEEWKWNNPAWSGDGLVLGIVAETNKATEWLQITFFQGAALKDPRKLFNAGLDSKTMRYIKIRKDDAVDEAGLRALVKAAAAYNRAGRQKKGGAPI